MNYDRKKIPLASGMFDYFPDALVEVAKVSFAGNEKHNPGEPLHWARGKSGDHADAMLRHFKDRGGVDPENGLRHSAEMAWRALAVLQEELEAAGAPRARGARLEKPEMAWQALTVLDRETNAPGPPAEVEALGTCRSVREPHPRSTMCLGWRRA